MCGVCVYELSVLYGSRGEEKVMKLRKALKKRCPSTEYSVWPSKKRYVSHRVDIIIIIIITISGVSY